MGLKDTVTTKYMRQSQIFADAFNYYIYGGEQVIDPDGLEELDTREVDVPYGGEDGVRMNSLNEQITEYLTYCECRKHLNPKTLKAYRIDLKQYELFCSGLADPTSNPQAAISSIKAS